MYLLWVRKYKVGQRILFGETVVASKEIMINLPVDPEFYGILINHQISFLKQSVFITRCHILP